MVGSEKSQANIFAAGIEAVLRNKAFVNGAWVTGGAGRTFGVLNPATGAHIADIPDMDAADAEKAVVAAKAAFPAWSKLTAKDRGKILLKWHRLIMDHLDVLALLLTLEQGKPLSESKAEIISGAGSIEWMAAEGRRIYGDTIPSHKTDTRIMVIKQPVGVVGAVTPWNFPNGMIARKAAPALAAGCTIVLKPSEDAPLSALALALLAQQAGFPPGVFNIVTGARESAAVIGKVLSTHPDVRKISFTGSTAVGKILAKQAADTVKRVSLELGGNAPFIVFRSADLDKAVEGAIVSKFRNAGQTCICANRIYVQDSIYDSFAEKLATRVKKMKIGSGVDEGVEIGPLINERGLEKVRTHVADAIKNGAELICGGTVHPCGPLFYQPTILKNMTAEMLVKKEETFGPVAGLFRFRDEAEAVAQANDTPYGLAAYFYSQDLGECFRVAEALECGMVGINEPLLTTEAAPFGGVKESGLGIENSYYGIEQFVNIKYILIGGIEKSG